MDYKKQIARIFDLFINRSDVYAMQTESGYVKISEPITEELIEKHLKGEITIGTYQFNKGNKIKWICFDFDGETPDLVWNEAKRLFLKLKLEEKIESVLLEFSGKKGYHVWVFVEEIDGMSARYWAEEISKEFQCEIFPKQETITEYGNLVKIPLGIHQVSKKFSEFVDSDVFSFNVKFKIPKIFVKEVIKIIQPPSTTKQNIPDWLKGLINGGVEETERNSNRFKIMINLKGLGYSDDEIILAVKEFNKNCRPPEREYVVDYHLNYTLRHIENYLRQGIKILDQIKDFELLNSNKEIFDKIVEVINDWEDLPENYSEYLACWIIGTYLHPITASFPITFINASKGSGKSRLLRICSLLANKGVHTLSFTEPVLFRYPKIKKGVTFFLDEADNISSKEKANLKDLIQACYKRGTKIIRFKKIITSKGEDYVPIEFENYLPLMIANIRGLDDVLQDRCITLILQKSLNKTIIKKPEYFERDLRFFLIKESLLRHYVQFLYIESGSPPLDAYVRHSSHSNASRYRMDSVYNGSNDNNDNNVNSDVHILPNYTNINSNIFEKYNKINYEISDFISSNIQEALGRDIELWSPILTVAKLISDDIFEKIFSLCKDLIKQKHELDIFENPEISLLMSLVQLVDQDNWYSIEKITQKMKEMYEETEIVGEKQRKKYPDWINNMWVGHRLRIMKLTNQFRRTRKRYVWLTRKKINDEIQKRGINVEDFLSQLRKEKEQQEETQTTLTEKDKSVEENLKDMDSNYKDFVENTEKEKCYRCSSTIKLTKTVDDITGSNILICEKCFEELNG